MILRSAVKKKNINRESERKSEIRFALFPTHMEANDDEKEGELIWLEKYIVTLETYQPYPCGFPDKWKWRIINREKLVKVVLDKFES